MSFDVEDPGEFSQLVFSFEDQDGPIERKFWEFHDANPEVYQKLRKLALEAKARGRKHFSAKALFEILRWYTETETKGSVFKLNNNYHALYARLLMRNEPELYGFFRIRKFSPQVIE